MEMSPQMAEQWAKREAYETAASLEAEKERAAQLAQGNRKTRRRLASS